MEYRSLGRERAETIHACFRDSFADYIVKVEFPFDKYLRHILRYGVDLKYSIGAYDQDKLVGFILNASGIWKGRLTIYDAGTGMLPEYRGQGHSKKMFSKVLDLFKPEEFEQYLLEVIQGNDEAFGLYQKQGFKIERELFCFKAKKEELKVKRGNRALQPCTEMDWGRMQSYWDYDPSWQNSTAAVTRYREHLKCIGAECGEGMAGYAFYEPKTGDILQLAIHPNHRKKGLATALVAYVKEKAETEELRILNVADSGTKDFLLSIGFSSYVDQYEMLLEMK